MALREYLAKRKENARHACSKIAESASTRSISLRPSNHISPLFPMRDPRAQRRATKLRRSLTDAESRIWYFLRRRHLLGFRFRRQAPIGPYIVDFLCLEAALVVELDGSQHADAMAYDARRERFLASHGLRVLRFWNTEVLLETSAVIEVILRELGNARRDQESTATAGLPPT